MIELSAPQFARNAIERQVGRSGVILTEESRKVMRQPVTPGYSLTVIASLVQLGEAVIVASSGLMLYLWRVAPVEGFSWQTALVIAGVAALTVALFNRVGLHERARLSFSAPLLARFAAGWIGVFATIFSLAFAFKAGADLSRVWLGSWFVLGGVMLLTFRGFLSLAIARWTREGKLSRRTVIVGGGAPAEELISAIEADGSNDLKLLGVFDDRADERSAESAAGVPKLGNIDQLIEFARHTRIDLVLVTLPLTAEARVLDMIHKLWVLPVDIRLSAQSSKLRFHPRAYSYIGNVPVLDIFDRPIADWDVATKWLFDKVVGALALLALSPIFLATAIAIKLDSKGPVFFRQKRYGFNNKMVEVYKFRSMRTDMSDANASKLVSKGDPRVTRVGAFIRKTSIDELPQLINVVFRNDLSLVGPRPHAVHAKAADELYHNVVHGYFARHKVKPGITGWAQINGWRGETDTEEKIQKRVEHDLYYIENWSLLFDAYILFKTPLSLATHKDNAY